MEYLYQKLEKYETEGNYPFHMPGHKRNKALCLDTYGIDITEIDGFDNLHHPEDVIMEAQQRAARQFGAEETFFLVNGSSCGLLAAISAVCGEKSTLLVARNSHKSVYHAILQNRARAEYLYPEYEQEYHINGGIDPKKVYEWLNNCAKAKKELSAAVVITSPTYDGVVSDVAEIAGIAHEFRIPLIVDEAHGAHFPLDPNAPLSAIQAGADLVIQSVHKTLPSLTQTSLLHVQGKLVDRERLKKYLQIYQSSSPSYVLMASIDKCLHLMQEQGETLFLEFHRKREELNARLAVLKHLRLFGREQIGNAGIYDYDEGKILISTAGTSITGKELYDRLRMKYHLQMEMAAPDYIVAIMTVMDTQEGVDRLAEALLEIDECLMTRERRENSTVKPMSFYQNKQVLTIAESFYSQQETAAIAESEGNISAEFIYAYPPGIPILAPGEIISTEVIQGVREYRRLGMSIQGLTDETLDTIQIIKEQKL